MALSSIAVALYRVSLAATILLLMSCNAQMRTFTAQNSEPVSVNEIPKSFEPSFDPTIEKNDNSVNENSDSKNDEQLKKDSSQFSKDNTKESFIEPSTKIKTKPSNVIEAADIVMRYEGQKLKTPCNYYLQRVLEVIGFPAKDFLASEFYLYAKKYFKNYKAEKFVNNTQGSDRGRLKKYLWSFPERTAFILQWSSSLLSPHGHVAIVERVDQQLIIYQSSLNKYTARKDQTTVDRLLNGWARRELTVFSGFEE